MSVRARAPSISAPAAADEASHARSTLLASVASRRMVRGVLGQVRRADEHARGRRVSSSGGEISGARLTIHATSRSTRSSVDGDEPASDLMSSSAGPKLREQYRAAG